MFNINNRLFANYLGVLWRSSIKFGFFLLPSKVQSDSNTPTLSVGQDWVVTLSVDGSRT